MKPLLLFSAMLFLSTVNAAAMERKLFTLEKTYNPQNIMVIHAITDSNCRFVSRANQYLDFYWLINGNTRKEVHEMIRSTVQERVKFIGIHANRESFRLTMNDLKEVDHDLTDKTLEVVSIMSNGICQVKSLLNLGPSGRYRRMDLKRTFCEVSTNFVGLPNGCKTLELQGVDADTGTPLKVKFKKK